MKKSIIALCVVLAVVLCSEAFAAEIHPMSQYGLSSGEFILEDCQAYIGFGLNDITDKEVFADVYSEDIFDVVDINQLAAGDTIYVGGMAIEVESVDRDDGTVLINGGFDENGITLYSYEDTNGWTPVEWDLPIFTLVGQAQLTFADLVTVSIYKCDEELNPTGEGYDSVTVPAAQVKAEFEKHAEILGDEFSPEQASAVIENGKVIEIVIDYVP